MWSRAECALRRALLFKQFFLFPDLTSARIAHIPLDHPRTSYYLRLLQL